MDDVRRLATLAKDRSAVDGLKAVGAISAAVAATYEEATGWEQLCYAALRIAETVERLPASAAPAEVLLEILPPTDLATAATAGSQLDQLTPGSPAGAGMLQAAAKMLRSRDGDDAILAGWVDQLRDRLPQPQEAASAAETPKRGRPPLEKPAAGKMLLQDRWLSDLVDFRRAEADREGFSNIDAHLEKTLFPLSGGRLRDECLLMPPSARKLSRKDDLPTRFYAHNPETKQGSRIFTSWKDFRDAGLQVRGRDKSGGAHAKADASLLRGTANDSRPERVDAALAEIERVDSATAAILRWSVDDSGEAPTREQLAASMGLEPGEIDETLEAGREWMRLILVNDPAFREADAVAPEPPRNRGEG